MDIIKKKASARFAKKHKNGGEHKMRRLLALTWIAFIIVFTWTIARMNTKTEPVSCSEQINEKVRADYINLRLSGYPR